MEKTDPAKSRRSTMDLIAIGEILIDLTQTGISPAGIP